MPVAPKHTRIVKGQDRAWLVATYTIIEYLIMQSHDMFIQVHGKLKGEIHLTSFFLNVTYCIVFKVFYKFTR